MQSKIDDYVVAQSIENKKDTMLGFCDFYDKEFNLIVQLFPNIMQLELALFSEKDILRPITQYIRYYKYYKLTISKIVFNPR